MKGEMVIRIFQVAKTLMCIQHVHTPLLCALTTALQERGGKDCHPHFTHMEPSPSAKRVTGSPGEYGGWLSSVLSSYCSTGGPLGCLETTEI